MAFLFHSFCRYSHKAAALVLITKSPWLGLRSGMQGRTAVAAGHWDASGTESKGDAFL